MRLGTTMCSSNGRRPAETRARSETCSQSLRVRAELAWWQRAERACPRPRSRRSAIFWLRPAWDLPWTRRRLTWARTAPSCVHPRRWRDCMGHTRRHSTTRARSQLRALSTCVSSPRAYLVPGFPTGTLRTAGSRTAPTRARACATARERTTPGRGRRLIVNWGSSSALALRATSSSSRRSLIFAPATGSSARAGGAPPTRRCAIAWGSRRWTRCATTCYSSDSYPMRARVRRISTSISRRVVEKRSSSTSTTRLGGIARLRSRTSLRTARAQRSAMSHAPSDTRPARRQPGPRAGERCHPSLAMRLGRSRVFPGTWASTRAAWCSPISPCRASARLGGPQCRAVRSSSGIRRTVRMLAS